MARTAEYSIKGYLYQFLKYLAEILAGDKDALITIEGAIEDIDITLLGKVTAVQCKYHEQSEKFTLSKIYKPVLLMLEHFSKEPSACDSYILFCHFPDRSGTEVLSVADLETIQGTTAATLTPIVKRIAPGADLGAFAAKLKIEFGPTVEDLQTAVIKSFTANGFKSDDVPSIIFPCAVQRIMEISTQASVDQRTVNAHAFLSQLKSIKEVTFTRWTRELATKKQIFERLRKNLKEGLHRNSRKRIFFIQPDGIENFDTEIVKFIKGYVGKYACKFLHNHPPIFVIAGNYDVGKLRADLFAAEVQCTTGDIGNGEFREGYLFRAPMMKERPFKSEFCARLANHAQLPTLGAQGGDEVFLINAQDCPWAIPGANIHRLEVDRLSDLEYAFFLRGTYD